MPLNAIVATVYISLGMTVAKFYLKIYIGLQSIRSGQRNPNLEYRSG